MTTLPAEPSPDLADLVGAVLRLHGQIRDAVVRTCEEQDPAALSQVGRDGAGDTIYAVDCVSEDLVVDFFESEVAPRHSAVLLAEGLDGAGHVVPAGSTALEAAWKILIDPIDGTRGLMYQKRSAWILTGIAPRGAASLSDISAAVQTEIPLVKQHLSDQLWAIRGHGVTATRWNRISGESAPLHLEPSQSDTIAHGFAMVARFFPGVREELAAIDEELVRQLLGPVQPGKTHCFEDQYISTGGQLYELMAGHDRFVADLRPLTEQVLKKRGLSLGICCHPYDLATELIARELGVVVTGVDGRPLSAPLDLHTDVAWIGYANAALQRRIEPLLQQILRDRGLV